MTGICTPQPVTHPNAAPEPRTLHGLLARAATQWPHHTALSHGTEGWSYQALSAQAQAWAGVLVGLGLSAGTRVAVYLEKRLETVVASFGTTAAGGVLVPINPVLKPQQVGHVVDDAQAEVLLTSSARWAGLVASWGEHPLLRHVVLVDGVETGLHWPTLLAPHMAHQGGVSGLPWPDNPQVPVTQTAAIFYTSGSTGKPKGVVLSHNNLVVGAISVAQYLGNHCGDSLLAALPLSFDAGFSQLTTAFVVGARVVLLNYLVPRDVLVAMARERVTGLTAVPPLYMQMLSVPWPPDATAHLRYWANTGGRMPEATFRQLRERAPQALPFLMYGLTEAFRSTYLPPTFADQHPDSIGRAIPNAEILVLRPDGTPCAVDEPGELVHRGPLVSQGYWNRPEETALRFRPLPLGWPGADPHERVVYSGDTVRRDAQGLLYFVGRTDEMIKSSGYRISPTEVEEVLYQSGLVAEAVVVGLPDATLGARLKAVVAANPNATVEDATAALMAHCRRELPAYMVPHEVAWAPGPLPRSPNGKLDRQHWRHP